MSKKIKIAKIVGAHGIKGFVKVAIFLENAKDLESYAPLQDENNKTFNLKLKNSTGKFWLAEVENVSDRNEAETLTGTVLYTQRAALPETKDGEILHADLIGLQVEDVKGDIIGNVHSIQNFGAGDLLDIGNKLMLPLNPQYYEFIDTDKNIIKINEAAEELFEILKG